MDSKKAKIQRAREVVAKRELNAHHYFGDSSEISAEEAAQFPADGPCCVLGALIQGDPDIQKKYMVNVARDNGEAISMLPFFGALAHDMEEAYGLNSDDLEYLQEMNDSTCEGRKEMILQILDGLAEKPLKEVQRDIRREDDDYDY